MSLLLPYSFPKAVSEEPDSTLPKDVQISKNLEVEREWVKVSPTQTSEPYVKTFSNANTPESIIIPVDDPLDEILAGSQEEILEYSMDLPFSKKPVPKLNKMPSNQLLIRKRSRSVLEPLNQRQLDNSSNTTVYSGMNKTPTRNPVRVLSSSLKKPSLRESTASSERATVMQKLVMSKSDMKMEVDDADKSMGDPLACHAENIMRMAMDSTMLGSFCNNSFSSTFSNLADESALGRKFPDILGDSDRSITEHRAPMLAKLRAQKIEISAADLQEAVNGEFR
ncbi:CIC11C00000002342 [Sungouiella intermedia]|uniref:CIC11C00000002342 n=2 Tax=Sungouiella intermedia TaxID=45354 RepID=A0A1L0D4I9_9ASCO|nr:CIC11C00000002342 [[Candida] intermedia]